MGQYPPQGKGFVSRQELIEKIAQSPNIDIINPAGGWPGEIEVMLPSGNSVTVLLHAAPVTTHSRSDGELRVQSPGKRRPVISRPGALPVIVGTGVLDVLVGVDAQSRIGRIERWSVTFHSQLLEEAARSGWVSVNRPNATGGIEPVYAFQPAFLSVYIEMLYLGVELPGDVVRPVVAGTGLVEAPDDAAAAGRARRELRALVRDAAFSRDVKAIYGDRCALCELGLGLTVGAHVLPVAAPASVDILENGICLCDTHHRAFDKHMLYIEPNSLAVAWRPDVLAAASSDAAAQRLLDATAAVLRSADRSPGAAFLADRYAWYEAEYEWARTQ
jgi:hypothetical protein